MSKYNEIAYQILDELKLVSDDSHFQIEHILFLMDKFRSFLLKQRYSDIKKEIPESNFQTICLDLEFEQGDDCESKGYLKSIQEIPDMMSIRNPKVSTMDYFAGHLTYVNRERFKYVGYNKYLQNVMYCTIAPDQHLYIKSNNSQFRYLEKIKLTGVFEDSSKAAELSCEKKEEDGPCDTLEQNFPLEEALIPPLIELIVKELSGARVSPADTENNASDDLSRLATYLSRNLKKGWMTS